MAITVTQKGVDHIFGDRRIKYFDVVLDSSYPTGGSVFGAAEAGLRVVDSVIPQSVGGYNVTYDYVNGKIKIFQGDNANAAAGPGVEVPNATNLSAQTSRVRVEGY